MTRKSLLDQVKAIQMARTYCVLVGCDPNEIVAGYFTDATGCRRRVSEARWRWYRDIAEAPVELQTIAEPDAKPNSLVPNDDAGSQARAEDHPSRAPPGPFRRGAAHSSRS